MIKKVNIIIIIVAFLTSCIPNNTVVPSYIFFQTVKVLDKDSLQQIWRVKTNDDAQLELLFEQKSRSDKPIHEAFSKLELAAFEEWFSFREKGEYPPASKIYPTIGMRQVTLSSNGQWLAWIEDVSWGPPNSTIQFATIRLVALDLTSGKKRTLYEVAKHPNGWLSEEKGGLNDLAWAPNGQKLIVTEGSLRRHDNQAKIIDLDIGEPKNFGEPGEIGIFPSWSPDGLFLISGLVSITESITINISSVNHAVSNITLMKFWGYINGIDWSPDGKTIAFAASKATHSEKLRLYVINTQTKEGIELPLDQNFSYAQPKWSPDGKLIGLNAGSSPADLASELLIYDVLTQKVITSLKEKRSNPNFYWTKDGQAILFTKGSPPDTARTIEVFYWQENKTIAVPFPKGVDDGYAIGIWTK